MTINISDNSTTEYILSGLDPGKAYIVSVLAYTVGDGPRSIHLTVFTPLVSECGEMMYEVMHQLSQLIYHF